MKPWLDIWSAGHGVGSIGDRPTAADLISRMKAEYATANRVQAERFEAAWAQRPVLRLTKKAKP